MCTMSLVAESERGDTESETHSVELKKMDRTL